MSDEITITRKYVIYPIASDMKELGAESDQICFRKIMKNVFNY